MTTKIGQDLIVWYKKNKRDLPWRNTNDPYLIWVSEVILQQTRVDQGLSYYLRFVERFPTIKDLAYASEDEVLKYWQGLGYYSRARNMNASARQICELYKGKFPVNYDQIKSLKGVGPYTAAAIASIAFNLPYVVIDGNVNRVISRLFGIEIAVNTTKGQELVAEKLNTIFVRNDPANFNQAIMELGAMICKPSSPECNKCVLNVNCVAFQQNRINEFPVKIKLKSPKLLYLFYFILKYQNCSQQFVYLNKRGENAIWENLYDFPGLQFNFKRETNEVVTEFKKKYFLKNFALDPEKITGPIKHQLTHKSIRAFFIEFNIDKHSVNNFKDELIAVTVEELQKYPVSKLMENYIKSNL